MSEAAGLAAVRHKVAAHGPSLLSDDGQSRAAVALIVRPTSAADFDILFIKRAEHPEDPWSGHMALPGGRREAGETLIQAAQRETREEVGIDLIAAGEYLGPLDELGAMARGKRIPLVISPFVFSVQTDVATEPNHEVEELHWIAASALRDPQVSSRLPYQHEGRRYLLPCFRVAQRVIWGLTFRMLMGFFSVMDWASPTHHRILDGASEDVG